MVNSIHENVLTIPTILMTDLTSHSFNTSVLPSGGMCTGCFSLLGGVSVYILFIITCIYLYYMYFTSIKIC